MATRFAGLCVVLALAAGASGFAPQDAQWADACAKYAKNAKSRDPKERAEAVKLIGQYTSDKTDRVAVRMILQLLGEEVLKDKSGQEEKISAIVVEACETALKRIELPAAVDDIVKFVQHKGQNARARYHVIRALGAQASQQKTVAAFVEDPDPALRMAAIDALAAPAKDKDGKIVTKDPALLEVFMRVLGPQEGKKPAIEYGWEHKLAALAGIDALGIKPEDAANHNAAVDKLIVALAECLPHETRVKNRIIEMLGVRLGIANPVSDDPNWWLGAKADKNAPPSEGQTSVEPTEFFGLKQKSTRVIFVLDRTGSMSDRCTFKEPERKKDPQKEPTPAPTPTSGGGPKGGPGKEKPDPVEDAMKLKCDELRKKIEDKIMSQTSDKWTKMDGLKIELLRSIYNMDKRVHFTIVWYEVGQEFWKEQLVPATWANKFDCFKNIEKMQPSGGTDVFGGIEASLKFIQHPGKPGGPVEVETKSATTVSFGGVDTLFLMTDGNHNNGKFLKGDGKVDDSSFIAEIKKIHAMRKVLINVIALGDEGAGADPLDANSLKFLSSIAQATGGVFAHIGKPRE